jgi:hypothetical protein
MSIFEVGPSSLTAVEATDFAAAGLKERSDLQRLLRDQVSVVAPDVLVLAEEFGEWTESRRRIDLLAIDKNANIVVIELKRSEDGGHMELQALRYAAMVSTLTGSRAVEVLGSYLRARKQEGDAEQILLDFLGWSEMNEDDFGQDVRIVLVSADFSRELTTAVLWLNEKDLDIRCVRIKPYAYHDNILIDVQQVIPLPESADYQIDIRDKKRRGRASRSGGMDFTRYDVSIDGVIHPSQWKRNSILLVVKALLGHGVRVHELDQLFQTLRRRKLFYKVSGAMESVDEFVDAAKQQAALEGKAFSDRRWHLAENDLIYEADGTYVLSNQWGVHWPPIMQELKQRYPQIQLDYWPVKNGS